MAGMPVQNSNYGKTYDPHFGWETPEQKATRTTQAQHAASQQQFISGANNRVNYSMAYTDPNTGFQERYDPTSGGGGRSSGSGAGGSGNGDVDVNGLWQKTGMMAAPPPVPVPPTIPHVSLADDSAARDAEFSKAKDTVGRVGRASLNALSGEMRSRGISGSGIEAAGIGARVDRASGALGDVANNQAIDALKRRAAIDDENYQGDIGQRGQDIGVGEANASRALQALGMRANMHTTLMNLAARGGGRVY